MAEILDLNGVRKDAAKMGFQVLFKNGNSATGTTFLSAKEFELKLKHKEEQLFIIPCIDQSNDVVTMLLDRESIIGCIHYVNPSKMTGAQ